MLVLPAAAQIAGRLSGTVLDPQTKNVRGARVVLYLAGSDVEDSSTLTNDEGGFLFPVVRPGYYDLVVEADGFKRFSIKSVKIDPLAETTLPPIPMEVGEKRDITDVGSPGETLNTSDGQVSSTVRSEEVSQLPIFQRDPLQLLDTLPGVGSNGRAGTSRVINGQSVSFSNVTYDGINVQTSFIRPTVLESLTNGLRTDQLSEMTVVTVNPSSAYSGGSVQVAFSTPSGSNKLHGSAYWTYLPRSTAAQYWLGNRFDQDSDTKFQQMGAVVSGPVVKNKVFYFANYEGLFDRSTVSGHVNVPSARLTSSDSRLAQVLALVPDPNESRTFVGQFGGLFSDNYRYVQDSFTTRHLGLARIDWLKSTRHAVSATFSIQHGLIDLPSATASLQRRPNVDELMVSPFYSLSWRFTRSASLTNEVRVGANLPSIDFENHLRSTLPFVLTGYPGANPTQGLDPQGRNDYAYNYQDNLSLTRGQHSMRMGFSAQLYRLSTYGINNGTSSSFLSPVYNVPNAASLASGLINSVTQRFTLTGPSLNYTVGAMPQSRLRSNLLSGYFQDDWKVKPGLTLNLGLRYDYLSPVREDTGTALLPAINSDPYASLYQPNYQFSFAKGGLYKPDRKDLGPYAGLAWKPGRSIPVVFRGAYSISYVNDDLLRNMDSFSLASPWQGFPFTAALAAGTHLSDLPGVGNVQGSLPTTADLAHLPSNLTRALDPNLKTPYVQQGNAGVEVEVKGWLIDGRYVGNRLVKGLRAIDANQVMLPQAYLDAFRTTAAYLSSNVFVFFPGLINGGLPSNSADQLTVLNYLATGQAADLARFYQLNGYNRNGAYSLFANPNTGRILLMGNLGRSRYDSMQLTASRRMAGLTFLANYTFGKVLSNLNDYVQGAGDPYLDIKNPKLDRARAGIDLTHAIKTRWIYDLPFGKGHKFGAGKAASALGGWSLSGVIVVQSGAPFSLLSGLGTYNVSLDSAGRNTLTSSLTAGQIDQRLNLTFDGIGPRYFTATSSELSHPAAGNVGNLSLRAFNGPWQETVNVGLHKRFSLGETSFVEVRGEAFNLLNHVDWVIPDQTLFGSAGAFSNAGTLSNTTDTSVQFGRTAFQSNSPRRVQFTLRLSF